MVWTQNLAAYLGTFIVWGFLMAFFFNLLMGFLLQTVRENRLLIIISGLMFTSYFTSDHFFNLFPESDYYLTFITYDLVTLGCILLVIAFIKGKTPAKDYIVLGLLINSLLFFAMYVDIRLNGNVEAWWLWGMYSIGVNIIDFIMIFVLITNRDLLGLVKFRNSLKLKKALN